MVTWQSLRSNQFCNGVGAALLLISLTAMGCANTAEGDLSDARTVFTPDAQGSTNATIDAAPKPTVDATGVITTIDAPSVVSTIDANQPQPAAIDTVIDSQPNAYNNSTTASVAFHATRPATFQCTLDGGAPVACTSPFQPAVNVEGTHDITITATAIDDGTVEATPADVSWTLDLTPPDSTLVSSPKATTNSAAASFDFSSSDPTASFQCSLDNAAFTSCTSELTITVTAGQHTLLIEAIDPAGNVSNPVLTITWTYQDPASDPCTDNNGGCDPLASCNSSSGSVVCCGCPVGYTGNGTTGCQILPATCGIDGLHLSNDITVTGEGDLVSVANSQSPNDPNASVTIEPSYQYVPSGVHVIDAVSSSHGEPTYGLNAFCFATTDGNVFCNGDNSQGQLGNGTLIDSSSPVEVLNADGTPLDHVVQLTGANAAFYALRSDGTAWSWGHNGHGELGVGDTNPRSTATLVTSGVTKLITGPDPIGNGNVQAQACALITDGSLQCWGTQGTGLFPTGWTDPQVTPITMQLGDGSGPLTGITDLGGTTPAGQAGSAAFHVCGKKDDGTLWCFGLFGYGFATAGLPDYGANVWQAASNVTSFFNNPWGMCWTATDTTVWCTGASQSGEDGGTDDGSGQMLPVQIYDGDGNLLTGAVEVVGGIYQSSCARMSDGTAWCWGQRYTDHQATSDKGFTAMQVTSQGQPLTGITQLWAPTNSGEDLFIAVTSSGSYMGTESFNYAAHLLACP